MAASATPCPLSLEQRSAQAGGGSDGATSACENGKTSAPPVSEDGSSAISALFGVAIFLGFLLFAAQILIHLYATSAVSAAAFDTARLVAAADGIDRAAAEDRTRQLLGAYGAAVAFDWSGSSREQVVLRVTGPTPARMIQGLAELTGLKTIDRQVRVRVERFREAPL